jgi:hypothetical protein
MFRLRVILNEALAKKKAEVDSARPPLADEPSPSVLLAMWCFWARRVEPSCRSSLRRKSRKRSLGQSSGAGHVRRGEYLNPRARSPGSIASSIDCMDPKVWPS